MRETLEKYADDAAVSVAACTEVKLALRIVLPSRGGEAWNVVFENLVHLDISNSFIRGHADFGGLELVPEGYFASRDQGGECERETDRIARFTDINDNQYYVIADAKERYTRVRVAQRGLGMGPPA